MKKTPIYSLSFLSVTKQDSTHPLSSQTRKMTSHLGTIFYKPHHIIQDNSTVFISDTQPVRKLSILSSTTGKGIHDIYYSFMVKLSDKMTSFYMNRLHVKFLLPLKPELLSSRFFVFETSLVCHFHSYIDSSYHNLQKFLATINDVEQKLLTYLNYSVSL